jgi:hypothetical protein
LLQRVVGPHQSQCVADTTKAPSGVVNTAPQLEKDSLQVIRSHSQCVREIILSERDSVGIFSGKMPKLQAQCTKNTPQIGNTYSSSMPLHAMFCRCRSYSNPAAMLEGLLEDSKTIESARVVANNGQKSHIDALNT